MKNSDSKKEKSGKKNIDKESKHSHYRPQYEQIVNKLKWENLPQVWKDFDLEYVTKTKKLHPYQSAAIRNGALLLYLYYQNLRLQQIEPNRLYEPSYLQKKKLFDFIRANGRESIDLDLKFNKHYDKKWSLLREFYPYIEDGLPNREKTIIKIGFENFVNRMSFWMATGSGKSIIIIKFILFLYYLIMQNEIPNLPILILTQREDLIIQFMNLVDECNLSNPQKIIFDSLKSFGRTQYLRANNTNQVHVFIYRSDLIAEESKEKEVGYLDIENDGKWYLFLDEAHKGDADDSIRKLFFSILCRNGFLFNFSATFTDPWDIFTTVFNFNLGKFIADGYGKNLFVVKKHLSFSKTNLIKHRSAINHQIPKGEIVSFLKPLILFLYISWAGAQLRKEFNNTLKYHHPLIVCLVNSVNVELSDLERFFLMLGALSTGVITESDYNFTKNELKKDLKAFVVDRSDADRSDIDRSDSIFTIGDDPAFDLSTVEQEICFDDFKQCIFHSKQDSTIEIMIKSDNKEELLLKLKNSEKPFGLIKIGDIKPWIREKLTDYEITETYMTDKAFLNLNSEENPINLLMGSRSFYEGWDSNRPNVMIFLNIGNIMAKKFAIQAIGRGLRIEPIPNLRKRLQFIKKDAESRLEINNLRPNFNYSDFIDKIYLIETLFIFGTNSQAIISLLDLIHSQSMISEKLIADSSNRELSSKEEYNQTQSNDALMLALPNSSANTALGDDFESWVGDARVIFALRKMRNRA